MPRKPQSEITAFYPVLELSGFALKNASHPPILPDEARPGACIKSRGVSRGSLQASGTCRPPATAARWLPWGTPGWGEEGAGRLNPSETARFKPSGPRAVNTDLWRERATFNRTLNIY